MANKSGWLHKLDIFFGKGIHTMIPELVKTMVAIRFWLSIAVISFIIFLFGFLLILYKIFVG